MLIPLTFTNGDEFYLNTDHILSIRETQGAPIVETGPEDGLDHYRPGDSETLIAAVDGSHYRVQESPLDVLHAAIGMQLEGE